ncbi:ABC transporter permease [Actinacidiphila acididurans]|uniref:Autoinducer 2 import system permease protein LsrD n=1 Tax=Actinacidiphila acididurans TaxID=2784346 RepID=A0ABS2TSP0_9ACTN|nr:ABC transporter permease [Actinacidiphila acididurans]MBM9506353.1 ABC transporter permease [Actinacidiphila acididurans]
MTTLTPPERRPRLPRLPERIAGTETTLAALAVAGYVVLAATTHGAVVSGGTLTAIFQFLAVPMVIGLSQMAVLSVGQMNLGVGVLTGFCAMVCAWLMVAAGLPAWLAVAGALLTGAAIGLVNGLLVVLTRINGFVVTLATMTIIDGLRYGVHGTATYQGYSHRLVSLGQGSVLGVPTVFLAAVAIAILVAFFFRSVPLGRRLLASGGNPLAARLSGVSNDRSLVVAHLVSGLLAGAAGVMVVALSGSVNATIGDDLLLPSFAAPIIGGVALAGGVVSVLGTCLAALIIRLVDVAQAQYSINPDWVDLIVGAVVLGAVLITQLRRPRAGGTP